MKLFKGTSKNSSHRPFDFAQDRLTFGQAGVQLIKEPVHCTDKTAFYLKPLDSGLRRNDEI